MVSDAVNLQKNPEFLAAKKRGAHLVTRSQALASVVEGRKVLAVTGSHGKSSTTAMLVLGDALAMALLDARGFSRHQFAKHHPAGAIGKALLLKVGEIMRSGERNPVAPESMTVKESLFIMTRTRSGSLSVVNDQGTLAGVFTDGDLRRAMAASDDILGRPLRDVMTRNPICIPETALATEAITIFNERHIDDLIVIDAAGKPVGMIDSQDLPKLKLI